MIPSTAMAAWADPDARDEALARAWFLHRGGTSQQEIDQLVAEWSMLGFDNRSTPAQSCVASPLAKHGLQAGNMERVRRAIQPNERVNLWSGAVGSLRACRVLHSVLQPVVARPPFARGGLA